MYNAIEGNDLATGLIGLSSCYDRACALQDLETFVKSRGALAGNFTGNLLCLSFLAPSACQQALVAMCPDFARGEYS